MRKDSPVKKVRKGMGNVGGREFLSAQGQILGVTKGERGTTRMGKSDVSEGRLRAGKSETKKARKDRKRTGCLLKDSF